MKKTKKYLLTDFNTERWKGIQVDELNKKIKTYGHLYGELGYPETPFDVSLKNASHIFTNITFLDGKIYGDVRFLDNKNGNDAKFT